MHPEGDADCGREAPTTKATAPMTTALATSTEVRWGVAVKVVRMRPRRYSTVMNIVATTMHHDQRDDEPEPEAAGSGIAHPPMG